MPGADEVEVFYRQHYATGDVDVIWVGSSGMSPYGVGPCGGAGDSGDEAPGNGGGGSHGEALGTLQLAELPGHLRLLLAHLAAAEGYLHRPHLPSRRIQ